ncbi:MAG: hypothetical protein IH940_00395 [Acidobacteria bacterium]|nr:hypothetical protein [Acidobacteriota bacterium]
MSENSSPETSSADEHDWPAEAADKIVDLVGQVKGKTTRPAMLAARSLVYGIVLVIVALSIAVLLLVALFRITDYLPGDVYWAYLVWGVLFTTVGLVLWSKRPA